MKLPITDTLGFFSLLLLCAFPTSLVANAQEDIAIDDNILEHPAFAIEDAGIMVEAPVAESPLIANELQRRQRVGGYCPRVDRYCRPGKGCCTNTSLCALPDQVCCPNTVCDSHQKCCHQGCTGRRDMCCRAGHACKDGKKCCHDGCIPEGAWCCSDGTYCPQGEACWTYDSNPSSAVCRTYGSDSSPTAPPPKPTEEGDPPPDNQGPSVTSPPSAKTSTYTFTVTYSYWTYWLSIDREISSMTADYTTVTVTAAGSSAASDSLSEITATFSPPDRTDMLPSTTATSTSSFPRPSATSSGGDRAEPPPPGFGENQAAGNRVSLNPFGALGLSGFGTVLMMAGVIGPGVLMFAL